MGGIHMHQQCTLQGHARLGELGEDPCCGGTARLGPGQVRSIRSGSKTQQALSSSAAIHEQSGATDQQCALQGHGRSSNSGESSCCNELAQPRPGQMRSSRSESRKLQTHSSRAAVHVLSDAADPSVNRMENLETLGAGELLPCEMRRVAECCPGGEEEERSHALVPCKDAVARTVERDTAGDFDDEPEVEGFVEEASGRANHGDKNFLGRSALAEIEGEEEAAGQDNEIGRFTEGGVYYIQRH
ncbi:hypothetical protein HN51_020108 [Arachis hypogaea]